MSNIDIDDLILVSVDDHVVEPPHLFDGRLEARFQDGAPRLIRKDDGTDVWTYDGREFPADAAKSVRLGSAACGRAAYATLRGDDR